MPVKPAHAKTEDGPLSRGKGLDSLEGFIIQNWAPSARFGLWSRHQGALAAPRASLAHFLDEHLRAGWAFDGGGAVITIDPPGDPFVTLLVEPETRAWTPESRYNPKHWVWKVVPMERAIAHLQAASMAALPEAERGYLLALREGRLQAAWDALGAGSGC
jgi:hypothetical protein